MPLVDVGGAKTNFLPAELCEILPNQAFKGKLTDEHTAEMIKVAAKPPNVNAQSIVGPGLTELGFKPNGSQQLNTFGISIGNEMTVVPGRILSPPGIQYGQGKPDVDDRASWNLRNVKFAQGARLTALGVLVIQDGGRDEFSGPDELNSVVRGFLAMCKTSGMSVPEQGVPPVVRAQLPRKDPSDPTRAAAINVIMNTIKTLPGKPSLILVILSGGDKHVYSGIKHLCDCTLDVGKRIFNACDGCAY